MSEEIKPMRWPSDFPSKHDKQTPDAGATISGYRQLTVAEIGSINEAKELEKAVEYFLNKAADNGALPRELALARTNIQQGFMWAVRSLAKPE